jgi:hypothetical protein
MSTVDGVIAFVICWRRGDGTVLRAMHLMKEEVTEVEEAHLNSTTTLGTPSSDEDSS